MKKTLRRLVILLGRLWGFKAKGPFRRYLTMLDADTLATEINRILGTNLDSSAILRTARNIRRIERKMIGRIAGDIDDHILNYYLVNHAAQELPAEALFIEIGVLFGGSLLVMMQALKDAKLNRKIVAVDPLESYYGDSEDPITLLPITRDNVLRNIRSLNPHHDSFTLISTPSQSPQTVVSLQNIEIGVIYIDGDHSYEGVKSDWVNYSPLVVVGGYVLIDNYHDNYDGIDRFIDEELIPNCKSWAVAGMLNRSIVFVRQEN